MLDKPSWVLIIMIIIISVASYIYIKTDSFTPKNNPEKTINQKEDTILNKLDENKKDNDSILRLNEIEEKDLNSTKNIKSELKDTSINKQTIAL